MRFSGAGGAWASARIVGAVACVLALAGCGRQPEAASVENPVSSSQPEWFQELRDTGVDFVHDPGATGAYRMPEHIGSGGALLDYDRDGRLDFYLVQNGGPGSGSRNQLYHQETDGRFRNVTEGSGLDAEGYGMGAAVGDVNNDGWDDVVLTEYGAVRLFVNGGAGRFTEIQESGLDNPEWATSAALFDFDRDGWLDLVVANYVDADPSHQCYDSRGLPDYCGPGDASPSMTRLFRNRGGVEGARFEDVTVKAGLAGLPGPALGVVCADFNGDHWPDILLADDESPNRLFVSQRNGTFSEQGAMRGIGYDALGRPAANMGVGLGDVDGDGRFDLFITHLGSESHTLWLQRETGVFEDRTARARLIDSHWRGTGFGTALVDFDQDGWLDLMVVNGRIKRDPAHRGEVRAGQGPDWSAYAERDQLFANRGDGTFVDLSESNFAVSGQPLTGRGLACGDLDNDGAMDVLVTSIAAPPRLLKNVAERRGHWLMVRVVNDEWGGRDAYGSEVRVRAAGRTWWRLASPFYSYLVSNDPRVHFGLGSVTEIDSIEVIWPDGEQEIFPGGAVDRALVLRRGASKR